MPKRVPPKITFQIALALLLCVWAGLAHAAQAAGPRNAMGVRKGARTAEGVGEIGGERYLPLVEFAHDKAVWMPLAFSRFSAYLCPASSGNRYRRGAAFQYDSDDPVRPAGDHADKNLHRRGYLRNDDLDLLHLVDYGSEDPTQPPQLATLFSPPRVPSLTSSYRVYDWQWAPSPGPGWAGAPLSKYPVTALGLQTTPGELLHVSESGYDIGAGMQVIVLYADADTIALRYTREDSGGSPGYTVHVDGICTDPSLLALYGSLDASDGPRYIYGRSSYELPILPAGQPFGRALHTEIVVAIVDTGTFMDPRSREEWWQIDR